MDEVIDVTVVNFPDGTTVWIQTDEYEADYLDKCLAAWKESKTELYLIDRLLKIAERDPVIIKHPERKVE